MSARDPIIRPNCPCRVCEAMRAETIDTPMGALPRMVVKLYVCPVCGNKRCAHGRYHRYRCSGSNDTWQVGSEQRLEAPVCYNRGPAPGHWAPNGFDRRGRRRLRWVRFPFTPECQAWAIPPDSSAVPAPIRDGWVEWCATCRRRPGYIFATEEDQE